MFAVVGLSGFAYWVYLIYCTLLYLTGEALLFSAL